MGIYSGLTQWSEIKIPDVQITLEDQEACACLNPGESALTHIVGKIGMMTPQRQRNGDMLKSARQFRRYSCVGNAICKCKVEVWNCY